MKALLQRTARADVRVDAETVGAIGQGLLIFLGVQDGDTRTCADLLAAKVAKLRVFTDEAGKMNRSLVDIGGDALVVSQFTLCADTRKGNRPSFAKAMPPNEANELYEYFTKQLLACGVRRTQQGVFGAHMEVSLLNDGPVTIWLNTDDWMS
ncbi:MAG: D-tyrosyl-tRNA(Tyr) deacylase [Oscillospiraceae bacterium]|jgi:D-tyrosyl-tRNA(Tyr) deacylase|nr:D-tyrosyl-tRNA(Tyr) deacylase [Oscillospiraceae bacterium]